MHMPSEGWTAGVHYLKNLFLALRTLDEDVRPEISLLVASEAEPESYQELAPYIDEVLRMPLPAPWPGFWERQAIRIKKYIGVWHEPEHRLGPHLRSHNVDCVFANGHFGAGFGVPLVSWIPDFQHLHLPRMFSQQEIADRTAHFVGIAQYADRVVLSSQDAFRDFERLFPLAWHKARVFSFVAQVPKDAYDLDPRWVCDHYHLPERFIYLPNQFWKHKNHDTVLEALSLLRTLGSSVTVVCTGNTNEYRDPLHFAKLLPRISSLGLRDHFILLGLVPFPHVFALMRQSLAVLQPSLFEGWSTTVEETKSFGKRIILSDVPVHREQNPPQATYFDPCNAEELAACLVQAYDEYDPGPDDELESWAREQLPERTSEFAEVWVEALWEAVSSKSDRP